MNKKAASNIVISVLLIVICIAAIVMISNLVYKTVSVQMSPQYSCLESQISKPIEIDRVCYNLSSQQVQVVLQRKINSEIPSLYFVINSNSQTSKWCCSSECTNCLILEQGETKTYYFDVDASSNSNIAVLIDSCLIDSRQITDC
jgi:hypothetical protein